MVKLDHRGPFNCLKLTSYYLWSGPKPRLQLPITTTLGGIYWRRLFECAARAAT